MIVTFNSIDWSLLRAQKLWLLEQNCEHADGLVHIIDAIQDQAVSNGIASELEVFGFNYGENDHA